jgi:hypothetical protein
MYRPKKLVGLVLMFLCLAKLLHGAGSFDGLTADVTRGETVYGSGWACGYDQGAPVNYVYLYLDGGYYGNADLGGYRPDVQSANASYGGWSYHVLWMELSDGYWQHRARFALHRHVRGELELGVR